MKNDAVRFTWICMGMLLFQTGLAGVAWAATSSAESNVTTVDTRDSSLTVEGRVRSSETEAVISGATVTLAGKSATTAGNGRFVLTDIRLSSGHSIEVRKTGYATHRSEVSVSPGTKSHVMPDIFLRPSGPLTVTDVSAKYNGLFLAGVSLQNRYTAHVDWGSHEPGSVEFSNRKGWTRQVATSSDSAPVELDISQVFQPSFTPGANVLEAVAISQSGVRSAPYLKDIGVIPLPRALEWLMGFYPFTTYVTGQIGLDGEFPKPPIKQVITLPVLGKFGVELAANLSLDYTFEDGEWELALGIGAEGKQGKRGRRPTIPGLTRYPKLKLYVGNKEISGKLEGGARGVASWSQGISFDEVFGHGEIEAKLELTRYGLLDLLGPGITATLSKVPVLSDLTKGVSIIIYAIPGIEGDLVFAVDPRFDFKSLEMTGKLGLEAAYEPDVGFGKVRAYVGGEPSVTLQIPGELLKELRFRVYAGFSAEVWILKFGPYEYVFLDYRYPSAMQTRHVLTSENERVGCVPAIGASDMQPTVVSRDYLADGTEQFVAGDSVMRNLAEPTATPLDNFRLLSRTEVRGSVMAEAGNWRISAASGQVSNQVDLALVRNVFPNSQPVLASHETNLMLLYVSDSGITNDLQFTDIRWSRWDGANWSVPLAIETNTQAEFAPQVAFDGNGDAVAVWERISDPNFTNVDLTLMAQQMEIIWSRWSRASGGWSRPVALTTNDWLDHAPLLGGPLANGDLLLAWTENQSNLLMGASGAAADRVRWARWSASTEAWSGPAVLVEGLADRVSQSLAGAGGYAAYAWARDMDGVLTNENDQELFLAELLESGWSAPRRLTTNDLADRNVRMAVAGDPEPETVGVSVDFEDGGFGNLHWSSGGTAAWTVQNSVAHAGSYGAASGTINHGEFTSMKLTLDCVAGDISFFYKVSSESGYDKLRFFVDGQEKASWSGSVNWTAASYSIAAGPHGFEWRYSKDGSVSSGSDRAWIDDITLPIQKTGMMQFLAWQQDTNLVMSRDLGATIQWVRMDSQTLGFSDYELAAGPAGNLVLLWQEMSQDGSDAHYMVYDPASDTWGKDDRLCYDSSLECSFAPVWDAMGNLTLAYDKVEIVQTNKTVTLEGGETVTITNVPQPGRVDLMVTKRALVKDLALSIGDFTVNGGNYLPGDPLTLTAVVRNSGNVAVSNAVVSFFDGDPDAGGTFITNVTHAGWLEAAASAELSATWIVSEPAGPHTLYAVVDRAGGVTEYDEGNNVQSVRIGGTDLTVSLKSARAETNGAVRVIALVRNQGTPTSPGSVLAIHVEGQTNEPLEIAQVPALEPGQLAEVALDLPPGTQPEGDQVYRLIADAAHVVSDIDTSNNTAAFGVRLWIDADGDGMPNGWEQENGLNPGDSADASKDKDEDGLSNLAEYTTGTDPSDKASYLFIRSIGGDAGSGIQINWGSAPFKLYTIERTSDLSDGFLKLIEHVQSTPPENVYMDLTATNDAPYFYRIQVE